MRRWIALLLLCLFALQSTWAVAAAYCQHEKSPGAAHVGHHDHDHEASAAQPDLADDGAGAMTVDLDCHACHTCTACFVSEVAPAIVGLAGGFSRAMPDHPLPAPPLATVERPDWQRLA